MESGEIRLEDGVLRAPDGLYPLRNISFVGQHTLGIDRDRLTRWKLWASGWLFFLVLALMAMDESPSPSVLELASRWALFLIPESLFLWRLHRLSHAPPVYALTINTSGVEHDVAWSWDGAEIQQLVDDITRALSYPDSGGLHYYYVMRHTVEGDVIHQYGDRNTGKAQHFGSGNIGER